MVLVLLSLGVIVLARRTDGRLFTQVVANCHVHNINYGMAEVAGRVTVGRRELAEALRFTRHRSLHSLEHSLLELVWELSWYRDYARLLGDTEDAASLQAIIERHGTMLADPRRALAIQLLEYRG